LRLHLRKEVIVMKKEKSTRMPFPRMLEVRPAASAKEAIERRRKELKEDQREARRRIPIPDTSTKIGV